MTEVLIRNGTIKTLPNLGIVPYDSSYSQTAWNGIELSLYTFYYGLGQYYIKFFEGSQLVSPEMNAIYPYNQSNIAWPMYTLDGNTRQNTSLSPLYRGYGYVFHAIELTQPSFTSILSLSYTHNSFGDGNIVYTIVDMQLQNVSGVFTMRCRARNKYVNVRLDGWNQYEVHSCTATISVQGATYTVMFFIDTVLATTITFDSTDNGYTSYNWPNTASFDTFYMKWANIPSYPDISTTYPGYSEISVAFIAGWTMTSASLFTESNYASLVDLCINRYGLSQSTDCVEVASGELSTARFGSSTFNGTFYMW
jgi:hypothetical protein